VLAVYIACTLLVFSFILFEVLDVDASDFPSPTQTTSIKLVEPPHDLKRTGLSGLEALLVLQPSLPDRDRGQRPPSIRAPLTSAHARIGRMMLPRATLPAPAPSA
jgi:hypothetical protein